ncbi:DUF2891 domain-containing protein [Streptomyces axinellae]|uniref:DUF2891 domain-containing protein n=1 Tax=Streptomyces axinellae TaxID=552788 RepID=UPI0031DD3B60
MRDDASAAALAARAPLFAELALTNVTREYPNAPAHLIADPTELVPPRTYHPAFYGAYDWHSSVHMHWLLIRLLRLPHPPPGPGADAAQSASASSPAQAPGWRETAIRTLEAHLTAGALAQEAAYLRDRPSFERPYGWAWLLALTSESTALSSESTAPNGESSAPGSEHPPKARYPLQDESTALPAVARRWREALAPAAATVADLVLGWLPKATYPVRHGTHANSAFSLGLILDSAERAGQERLLEPVRAKVREWYVPDHGAAVRWEPSGQDFLSPVLCEADVVRRVLSEPEFAEWLTRFLPELDKATGAHHAEGGPGSGSRNGNGGRTEPGTECDGFMPPPRISDPADPQIGHLFGLCLSRAAALRDLAGALPPDDPRIPVLTASAEANLDAALPVTASGDFTTDHWLATFATLALDGGVAAR